MTIVSKYRFILPSDPNHDDALYELLNIRRKQYNDKSVLKLLRHNPGAARVKYEFKRVGRGTTYPLFCIISLGGSLKTVKACHRACPEALSAARTESKGSVLHTACTFRSDVGVVKYIHRKDPTLVRMTKKHRFTPLHLACAYGSSAEVVKLLIEWHPGALDVTNALGETPHASAINNHASEDVITALASASSGAGAGKSDMRNSSATVPSSTSIPP